MLGMGFSSTLSIELTEYNKLNASLSEINNDFNFDLSDSKIQNARKLLASDNLKNILKEIHKLYYEDFEYVQNKIISNVSLNVDIDSLYNEINDLFELLNNDLDYTEFKEDRLEFMNNFTELFEDLENWVYKDYKLQKNSITRLKSIENGERRRLDENINIEEIQDILNIIDYKITNLTSNIFNSEKLIDLQSSINQITSEINVQLITLKNTLDSYIKYVSFYLTKENLTPYSKNATDIYNTVNDILNDYLKNQSDIFNNILIILEEYSVEYNNNVKPKLINAINNVMKYSSKQLITKYLKNEENNEEENEINVEKIIEYITKHNYYLNIMIKTDNPFSLEKISLNSCTILDNSKKIEDDNSSFTLFECFEYFKEKETLKRGNEWYCKKCKQHQCAEKQMEFYYLPKLFVVCLKRFSQGRRSYWGGLSKNSDFINFPLDNMDMKDYVCGPDKNHSIYDCFAVSQHYGSLGGGHYTAICKNIDNKWYSYNDSSCSETSKNQAISDAAYVIFYRRKTD
jgi:hypothetical protein